MAKTRYGTIQHAGVTELHVKFPDADTREKFKNEFDAHHASHDHDGKVPVFENMPAGKAWHSHLRNYEEMTIDGYTRKEILAYHNSDALEFVKYRPPTTCNNPVIALNYKKGFVDSGTLQRHELSSVFGSMPDEDFMDLVESVKKTGFTDPLIRMYEGKVLDGWHRYCAALQLNLVRKLRFRSWNKKEEGDPVEFVSARNLERRMLNAGQRAQIIVALNERFGWGGDRSKTPNGVLKTKKELAQEAGVGTRTIDRAVQVEKTGRADEVIAGEKSAGQVIEEERLAKQRAEAQAALDAMWEALEAVAPEWNRDDFEAAACDNHSNWGVQAFGDPQETDIPDIWESRYDMLKVQIEIRSAWIQQHLDAMAEPDGDLVTEVPEDNDAQIKELREEVKKALKIYKEKYQYGDPELISRASLSMFIEAYREMSISKAPDQQGAATLEELKDLLGLLKRQSYPIAHRLRNLYGSDDTQVGLYDPDREPTPEADNPYTSAAEYSDKKLINEVIPAFTGQLTTSSEEHIIENAMAKLQLIGEELTRRGYAVDTMLLNIDKPEAEVGEAVGFQPTADTSVDSRSLSTSPTSEAPPEPDREGCKKELQRIYDAHGHLDNEKEKVVDFYELQKAFDVDDGTIFALIAEIIAEKSVEAASEAPEPSETDREQSKAEKLLKKTLKNLWDKRKQVATDYVGVEDTDLTQYTSLPELEKTFAAVHDYCADAFRSAIQRTSETSFAIMLDKTLDAGVSLEQIEIEVRTMNTYGYDIRDWQNQDWILALIAENKAKAESEASPETPVEPQQEASDGRASVRESQTDGNGSAHRQRNEQNPRPSADAFLLTGISVYFRREDAEGNAVESSNLPLHLSDDDDASLKIDALPDEIIRAIENFLSEFYKE